MNQTQPWCWGVVLAAALTLTSSAAAHQIERFPHADTTAGNFFGVAVAIEGTRAVVGASGEDVCAVDGGAAYVYEEDKQTRRWAQVARLAPSDCEHRRFFGRSVALSGDRLVIASSNSEDLRREAEVVYIYERDTLGTWRQTATLSAGDRFEDSNSGISVALSGDRAVLTTWGDTSHGRYGGAAYVFMYEATTGLWNETARLTGSGGIRYGVFGGQASIRGNLLVVPSSRYLDNASGSLYLFEYLESGQWKESLRIDGVDDFFISTAVDGDRILVGERRAGSAGSGIVTMHERDSLGTWHVAATLAPPAPYRHGAFGSAVALSKDRALVVGYDEQLKQNININRVVYVYRQDRQSRSWDYQGIIDIGRVAFGSAIALDGHRALVGAASAGAPGEAYIVRIP